MKAQVVENRQGSMRYRQGKVLKMLYGKLNKGNGG